MKDDEEKFKFTLKTQKIGKRKEDGGEGGARPPGGDFWCRTS